MPMIQRIGAVEEKHIGGLIAHLRLPSRARKVSNAARQNDANLPVLLLKNGSLSTGRRDISSHSLSGAIAYGLTTRGNSTRGICSINGVGPRRDLLRSHGNAGLETGVSQAPQLDIR